MVKGTDKNVKAAKKYKYSFILIAVLVCLLIFVGYKIIVLNKYQSEKVDINVDSIFNDTLVIDEEDYDGEYISINNMKIPNYFDGYVDVNGTIYKAKYNENNEIISFYSTGYLAQYINILDTNNMNLGTDNAKGKHYIPTSDSVKKFLDDNNIKDDVDLLQYIKDNYYFKSTIFTCTSKIKTNYLFNSFVQNSLPHFESITLISGKVKGYIFNVSNDSAKAVKELHILKDDKQYGMLLSGNEITNNEFIVKLLSSIKFD